MVVFNKFMRIEEADRPVGRDPSTLLLVGIAGLGTAHILVRTATATPYDAVIAYDPAIFLSTALNLLAGEGWRDFMGRPLVEWPPLFPLLLAAFGWVGIEPLAAGRWINATAFGLTILAAGCYLRSHLQARWLVLAATATLAASYPLSHWAAEFRTEPLFVLLTLLALVQLGSFLHGGGRTPLLWGAVCTALAALTRYPGVVLIGTGVLLLLVRRTPPLATRLKDASVFGATASLPLAGVLTRNWAIAGTPTGPRSGSGQSPAEGLSRVVEVFREWLIPPNSLDGLGPLLWITAGLVVVVSGLGLGYRREGRMGENKGKDRFGLGPVLPFGGFALAYLGFMVAIVPLVIPVEIPARYLLPVYVPLLLVAVVLLDRLLSSEAVGRRAAVRYGLTALVLLAALAHGGASAHSNLRLTARALEFGFGLYNISYWESSETLDYIRPHLREGRIYSNNAHLAWFWDKTADLGRHQYLPRRHKEVMPYIMRRPDGDDVHIVWFQHEKPLYDYNDMYIRFLPGVETVAELSDGVVFRVTAAKSFDAARYRARKQRYVDQRIQQADEQVRRAGWHVYRTGRTLMYRKQPCAPDDVQAKFVLHVYPVDPADLPAGRKQYYFENLDFHFNWGGERVADECLVLVRVPAYAIDRIRTAQLAIENRILWEAEFAPGQ